MLPVVFSTRVGRGVRITITTLVVVDILQTRVNCLLAVPTVFPHQCCLWWVSLRLNVPCR